MNQENKTKYWLFGIVILIFVGIFSAERYTQNKWNNDQSKIIESVYVEKIREKINENKQIQFQRDSVQSLLKQQPQIIEQIKYVYKTKYVEIEKYLHSRSEFVSDSLLRAASIRK